MATLTSRALALLLGDWRTSATMPVYGELADRIRLLVLDGRIALETRLPAERELAAQLGLSRTTVSSAYAALREAGFLDSVRGSGSLARLPRHVATPALNQPTEYLDFTKAALPAIPAIAAAAERAAAALPGHLSLSGFDPVGLPVLRQAIADRYTRRGVPTSADEVMITVGAQHAIALLARTLLGRGDRALVESPSYPHAYDAIKLAGGRLVSVAVTTEEGWDVEGLEQVMQRTSPALGYLMPDFHNPTGQSMRPALRERLLELAARAGTTIVADETMAELSLGDAPTELPLAAYGPAVTIGSVGKSVWGGVRVGWIRAERPLIQRLALARSASDLGTPILEQLVVTELLEDYDRILETRREQLRAGRDHLEAALARAFPEWRVPRPQGGLTAWVNIGQPVSSQLALAARAEGLLIAAGPWFGIDGAFERFLRIPFSYPAAEIDRAVGALAAAWRSVGRMPLPAGQDFMAQVV